MVPDPPENRQLNVKNLTFFSKKLTKIVIFFQQNCQWQFCWKKWQFLSIVLKKMSIFWHSIGNLSGGLAQQSRLHSLPTWPCTASHGNPKSHYVTTSLVKSILAISSRAKDYKGIQPSIPLTWILNVHLFLLQSGLFVPCSVSLVQFESNIDSSVFNISVVLCQQIITCFLVSLSVLVVRALDLVQILSWVPA